MTLGPDDLPDPGELSQVFCACTSGDFHYILSATTVSAVCAKCGAVNGSGPRESWVVAMGPPMTEPLPQRDTLEQFEAEWRKPGHHVQSGAAWGPDVPQPSAVEQPGQGAPPLPNFSAALCNVVFEGGDYDGQITSLPVPTETFAVAGRSGVYRATEGVRDGRVVYRWEQAG